MICEVSGGCAVGIGFLGFCALVLFVVTSWPAYSLGVLPVSEATIARVRGAVVGTSLAFALAATGALLLLVIHGC